MATPVVHCSALLWDGALDAGFLIRGFAATERFGVAFVLIVLSRPAFLLERRACFMALALARIARRAMEFSERWSERLMRAPRIDQWALTSRTAIDMSAPIVGRE